MSGSRAGTHDGLPALLVAMLLMWTLVLGSVHPAAACSYMQPELPSAADDADAVFVGRVTRVVRPLFVQSSADVNWIARIEVTQVFKGPVRSITWVGAALDVSCGYDFEEGETLFVFADMEGTRYRTGGPMGTQRLDMAHARMDLELLGQGTQPLPGEMGRPLHLNWMLPIGLGLAILAAIAVTLRVTRPRSGTDGR